MSAQQHHWPVLFTWQHFHGIAILPTTEIENIHSVGFQNERGQIWTDDAVTEIMFAASGSCWLLMNSQNWLSFHVKSDKLHQTVSAIELKESQAITISNHLHSTWQTTDDHSVTYSVNNMTCCWQADCCLQSVMHPIITTSALDVTLHCYFTCLT